MVSVVNLTVGKELLIGRTKNTNAHWIGGRLYRLGGMLDRIVTVTDSLEEISWGLNELLSRRPDFVVVVGGLGPTPDDMTLKGVAMGLGLELRSNQDAVRLIEERLARLGRKVEMNPARIKMATLPEGATPLQNRMGTAPGVRMVSPGGAVIFCLPGVPREMKSIFARSVEKEIRAKIGPLYFAKVTMKLTGAFESGLAPHIAAAMKAHPDAYIKSHPRGVKDGVSTMELDIMVSSRERERAREEYCELASFFTEKVAELGGKVASKRESMN